MLHSSCYCRLKLALVYVIYVEIFTSKGKRIARAGARVQMAGVPDLARAS